MTNVIGTIILLLMFMGIALIIPYSMAKQDEFNERMTAHHFSQYGGM